MDIETVDPTLLQTLNQTILAHQPTRLTATVLAEALAAAGRSADQTLEGRRLAAACALSDRWPMEICAELARALLGTAAPARRN